MSFVPPPAPAGYDPTPPARRKTSRARTLLYVGLGILCLAGIGVIVWLARRAGDVEGALLAILFATVPVPLVIGCFWWLDRYEPEPIRYLATAFAWGAVVAPLVVQLPYWLLERADVTYEILATLWAPIFEETAKGAFLLLVLWRRRHQLAGVADGLVYAGLVGIGFAFTENILYYAGAYSGALSEELEGPGATTGLFIVRGLFSPFSHSMFAGALGVGVGIAIATRRRWLKVVAPIVGLALAMGFHALWNGSVSYWGGAGFLLVYGLGFVPIFLGGIGLAVGVRSHQGRVAVRAFDDAAARGWLHPDEIPWLARFALRRRARRFAAAYGGPTAESALGRYQNVALQMAFAHDRVMLGRSTPDGPQRVGQLLAEMARLRPYILMPPPLWVQGAPHQPPISPPGPPVGWQPPGPIGQTGPPPGYPTGRTREGHPWPPPPADRP